MKKHSKYLWTDRKQLFSQGTPCCYHIVRCNIAKPCNSAAAAEAHQIPVPPHHPPSSYFSDQVSEWLLFYSGSIYWFMSFLMQTMNELPLQKNEKWALLCLRTWYIIINCCRYLSALIVFFSYGISVVNLYYMPRNIFDIKIKLQKLIELSNIKEHGFKINGAFITIILWRYDAELISLLHIICTY